MGRLSKTLDDRNSFQKDCDGLETWATDKRRNFNTDKHKVLEKNNQCTNPEWKITRLEGSWSFGGSHIPNK